MNKSCRHPLETQYEYEDRLARQVEDRLFWVMIGMIALTVLLAGVIKGWWA